MRMEELINIHHEVMRGTSTLLKRYLFNEIHWKAKALAIQGDRGVGKTTLMCQYLLEHYQSPDRALYISADNITVASLGLFKLAQQFFSQGGEALFIDEIHKYPNWSVELKNIIDTYHDRQIVFSGSSAIDLVKSKADLSRRVVFCKLHGLSFREYLKLSQNIDMSVFTLDALIKDHVKIAAQFKDIPLLKYFDQYLEHGYYPFFMEGIEDYLIKVNNVIEKVIFEDIAVIYNLRQATLTIL